jgi:L-fuconolactonase
MQRRTFLAALPAAALAPAATPPGAIDTHTHFYDPGRPGGVPWPSKTDSLLYRRVLPADFRKITAGLGVAATVVVEASPLLEDNQWILDLARDDRSIVGFIGHLDPASPDFPAHLTRFGGNPLFRGIRLGNRAIAEGLPKPEFVAGLRRMGDAGLTLDAIGPAALFADVVKVAHAVPKLKIVIDHLPFESQPGLAQLKGLDNVWAKVSAVSPKTPTTALDEVWDTFGPARVVYGSNWPVSERAGSYAEIFRIVTAYFKGKGALQGYLRDNSRQAYGWVDR